jgi:lipopolysaccharide export system protein LptC
MTKAAESNRARRMRFARPGGSHDRMVRVLSIALPALVGVVAALMIFAPLAPRGEVSFLLDRNKVDTAQDRARVDEALYRGEDDAGKPFSIRAAEAVQRSAAQPVVRMGELVARLLLPEGPAVLRAQSGQYHLDDQRVDIDGEVQFTAADGYRMNTRGVAIDLAGRRLTGSGQVEGEIPAGTFRADRMEADLGARTVTLEGNARLRMEPGKLRMP